MGRVVMSKWERGWKVDKNGEKGEGAVDGDGEGC